MIIWIDTDCIDTKILIRIFETAFVFLQRWPADHANTRYAMRTIENLKADEFKVSNIDLITLCCEINHRENPNLIKDSVEERQEGRSRAGVVQNPYCPSSLSTFWPKYLSQWALIKLTRLQATGERKGFERLLSYGPQSRPTWFKVVQFQCNEIVACI